MEYARQLEPVPAPAPAGAPPPGEPLLPDSPLARARLHRRLTVEETARRAGISEEELRWLEEGRVYRFPTADRALLAAMLTVTALGVDRREALALAGRAVPSRPLARHRRRRLAALAVAALALAAAGAAVALAHGAPSRAARVPSSAAGPSLPAAWRVKVAVLNGAGDIVWTRDVASRIQALSYRIVHVGRAGSFGYRETQVYYPPGGAAVAQRLAEQLGVGLAPLPGGADPLRLVVIVGPKRGP